MQLRASFITIAAVVALNGHGVLSLPLTHTEASSVQTHKPQAHEPELVTRIVQAEGRAEPTRGIEYDADVTTREPEVINNLSIRDVAELEDVDARDLDEIELLDAREIDEVEDLGARELEDLEDVDARELEDLEDADAREFDDLEDVDAREFEELDEFDAREFDEEDAIEARAGGTPPTAPAKAALPAAKPLSPPPKPASIVPNAKPNSNISKNHVTSLTADKNHASTQVKTSIAKPNSNPAANNASPLSSMDKNHANTKAKTPNTLPAAHKSPVAQQEKVNKSAAGPQKVDDKNANNVATTNHKHTEHEGQVVTKGSASTAVKLKSASQKEVKGRPALAPATINNKEVKSGGGQSQKVEKSHATAHSSVLTEKKNTSSAGQTRGKTSKQAKGPKHLNSAERQNSRHHSSHEQQHHFGSGERHEHHDRDHDHHRQQGGRDGHGRDHEHNQNHPHAHNHDHGHKRSSTHNHNQQKSQERSHDHNASKSSKVEPSPRAHAPGHDQGADHDTHPGMHHGSRFGHEGHLRSRSVRFVGLTW